MSGLIHSHSGLRWIVLAGLLIAIFNAYSGKKSGREFTEKDRKLGLIAFIGSHIQLLLGLVLYFTSTKVTFEHMMANAMNRFYTMEHSTSMLIAITLITIGYIKCKKASDSNKKFSLQFNFYLIALIIILASIPWPFRELGASWF
jgi:hypothetical protein